MALKRKPEESEAEAPAKPKKTKVKPEKKKAKARKEAKSENKQAKAPRPVFSVRAALALQMQAARDALALTDPGQAVHQTRIALKRLRVLARIAEHVQPQGGAALEYAAQTAMKRLASARDLAAIEHAARAVSEKASAPDRAFLTRAANDFARTRPTIEAFALSEAGDAVIRLAPIIDAVPETRGPDSERAARNFMKRARAAFKQARGSRAVLLRHAWRKREKDRRYAELMMGDSWPAKSNGDLESKLTEALGRERDAGLLLARLSANAHTPKGVVKQVKAFRRARARRADKLGARLHAR